MPTVAAHPDTSLILDTDIFTGARNKQEYVMREYKNYFSRLQKFPALAAITLFEALSGVESELAKNRITAEQGQFFHNRIDELTKTQEVLPLNEDAARVAAHIYARLAKSDQNKHWRDIFITATALAHRHGVATRNRRDFELIARHLPPDHNILQLALWKP